MSPPGRPRTGWFVALTPTELGLPLREMPADPEAGKDEREGYDRVSPLAQACTDAHAHAASRLAGDEGLGGDRSDDQDPGQSKKPAGKAAGELVEALVVGALAPDLDAMLTDHQLVIARGAYRGRTARVPRRPTKSLPLEVVREVPGANLPEDPYAHLGAVVTGRASARVALPDGSTELRDPLG